MQAPADDPYQLDRARRVWLDGLKSQHDRSPGTDTLLALARGEWRCGEYASSLQHFQLAAHRSPERLDAQMALVHAASLLGRRETERAALSEALRHHPSAIEAALHAARLRIPDKLGEAAELLLPHQHDPVAGTFLSAIGCLSGKAVDTVPGAVGDAMTARWNGFLWLLRQQPRPEAFVGLPVDVLKQAVALSPADGLTVECGVYFGRSIELLAARTHGIVHGFDSFEGLPEAWKEGEPAGAYSTGGRLPAVAGNVRLHRGWFEHTLPPFLAANPGPVRLLHVDCDIYSSTRTVLESFHDRLMPGSVLLFDDFLGYPGHEQHEMRAFDEFMAASGLRCELIAACVLGREVAFRFLSV